MLSINISRSNKINTNILMYAFLHYMAYVWINDGINLVFFFLRINQDNLFGNCLAVLLAVLLIRFDITFFSFEKFDKKCIWGVLIISCYSLYCFVYADISYDSMAYHVLNQNPIWYGDNNLVLWEAYFPLPDRMMYLPRYLFGYRAGTLFNSIVLIIIYVQIVRLLKIVLAKIDKVFFNPYFLAFALLMIEAVLMDLGTYLTDLVGIPLVIELILCILNTKEERTSFHEMIYAVACMAYLFLMKLTCVIYVIPILLIYLVLIRKSITVKKFLICLLCGLAIISPYVIYNFYLTGEIFYPYSFFSEDTKYSALFHDGRWGAQNWIEVVIWPWKMLTDPTYRQMELVKMPNFYPILGVLTGICLIIDKVRKKKINRNCVIICVIAVGSLYTWILLKGVYRYALASIILCGIAFLCYISYRSQVKIWTIITIGIFTLQMGCSIYSGVLLSTNWKFSPSIISAFKNPEKYWNELCKVGTDRDDILWTDDKYQYYVAFDKCYSAFGYLLNDESNVYEVWRFSRIPEETTADWYEELFSLQNEGVMFYTASLASDLKTVVELASKYGFYVDAIEYLEETYLANNLVIYHLALMEEANNVLITLNADSSKELAMVNPGQKVKITGSVMVSPVVNWTSESSTITFYTLQNDEKVVISSQTIYPGKTTSIDMNLDFSKNEEPVIIYAEASNNWSLDWDAIYLLNVSQQSYVGENFFDLKPVFYSFIDEYQNAEKIGETARADHLNGKTICVFENESKAESAIYITPNTKIRYELELDDITRVLEFEYGYFEAAKKWGSNGAKVSISINGDLYDEIIISPEDETKKYELKLEEFCGQTIILEFACYDYGDAIGDWILLYSPVCK